MVHIYFTGIDLGSTMTKVVIISMDKEDFDNDNGSKKREKKNDKQATILCAITGLVEYNKT